MSITTEKEAKITLTDGTQTWKIESEMYDMYIKFSTCEVCKHFMSRNCGKCLEGIDNFEIAKTA